MGTGKIKISAKQKIHANNFRRNDWTIRRTIENDYGAPPCSFYICVLYCGWVEVRGVWSWELSHRYTAKSHTALKRRWTYNKVGCKNNEKYICWGASTSLSFAFISKSISVKRAGG